MRKIKVVLVVVALAVSALSAHYALAQENTTEAPAIAPEKAVDVTAITPCPLAPCNLVCTNTPPMVCTNTPFCDRLAKELNLTDEQLTKLRAILAENRSMCRAQRGFGQGMRGNRGGRGLNPNCPLAQRQAIPVGKFQKGNPNCCLQNPDCPNVQPGQGKGMGKGKGMGRAGNCPLNNGKAMRGNRLGKNRNAGLCPNGNATQPIIINIYTDENKVTRIQ